MYERYSIIKKLYPNYLILMYKKNNLISINEDKDIIDIFGIKSIKNTNTIILNNLDIEKIDIYDNNQYDNYYFKSQIIKYLERIKNEKESNYDI